jgi:hypothetical protein
LYAYLFFYETKSLTLRIVHFAQILDLGLAMGSKDNMTALVIKFDGQKVGLGGGVVARRQLRDTSSKDGESSDLA